MSSFTYRVPSNLAIDQDGFVVPDDPSREATYERRDLNEAEAGWLEHLFTYRIRPQTNIAQLVGRPRDLTGTPEAVGGGSGDGFSRTISNWSAARRFCVGRWAQMISPDALEVLINSTPMFVNGVDTQVPLLHFRYDLNLLNLHGPSSSTTTTVLRGIGGVPYIVNAQTPAIDTYRVLTPRIFDMLRELIASERRRRRYAETVADASATVGDGSDDSFIADFYTAEEADPTGASIGRLWPTTATILLRPIAPSAHPHGSGGWFPYWWACWKRLPEKFRLKWACLTHTFSSVEDFQKSENAGVVDVDYNLGCLWRALTPQIKNDCQRTRLRELLWANTTYAPAGSTASVEPHRCRVAAVTYRQLGAIIRQYNDSHPPRTVRVTLHFSYHLQRSVHGQVGKGGIHRWGPDNADDHFELCCFGGHYFPHLTSPCQMGFSVGRKGLLEFLAETLSGIQSPTTLTVLAPRKRELPLSLFQIFQMTYAFFNDHQQSPVIFERITYGDIGSNGRILSAASELPRRAETYSAEEIQDRRMTCPAPDVDTIMERHELLKGSLSIPLESQFVVDFEDIPSTHEKYLVSICSLGNLTGAHSLFYDCSDVNLFRDYFLKPGILPPFQHPSPEKKRTSRSSSYQQTILIWCHNLLYDFPHIIRDGIIAGGVVEANSFLPKDGRIITCTLQFPKHGCQFKFVDSWRLFGPGMSVAKMPAAFGFQTAGDGVTPIRKELFAHGSWMGDGQILQDALASADPLNYLVPVDVLRTRCLAAAELETNIAPFPFETFLSKMKEEGFWDMSSDSIRLFQYASAYCRQDAYITARALVTFQRSLACLAPDFDALSFLSASSLSDGFFQSRGCYKGVCYFNGLLSAFFQDFVVGGRCCVAYNSRLIRTLDLAAREPLIDVDARSLYPSAFVALCKEYGGLLKGSPLPIDRSVFPTMAELIASKPDGYFVICDPLSAHAPPPIFYPFGLYGWKPARDSVENSSNRGGTIEEKANKKSLLWINDLREGSLDILGTFPRGLFFDRISFEDYLRHQPMYNPQQFTIRCGYVFRNGRNPLVQSVVEQLYQARVATKEVAMKNLLKLLLNGAYGKTLQKAIPYTCRVAMGSEEMFSSICSRHAGERVQGVTPLLMGEREVHPTCREVFVIQELVGYPESSGRPHCGAEILSAARMLMNRLTCLFPSTTVRPNFPFGSTLPRGMPGYTDTDSVHFYWRDLPAIQAAFEARYRYPLFGEALGQFHSDFPNERAGCSAFSRRAIFLTKKAYCHELAECPSDMVERGDIDAAWDFAENDPLQIGPNLRPSKFSLKGIPEAAVHHARLAPESRSLFEDLFEDRLLNRLPVVFNLGATLSGDGERPHFILQSRTHGFALQTVEAISSPFQRTVRF